MDRLRSSLLDNSLHILHFTWDPGVRVKGTCNLFFLSLLLPCPLTTVTFRVGSCVNMYSCLFSSFIEPSFKICKIRVFRKALAEPAVPSRYPCTLCDRQHSVYVYASILEDCAFCSTCLLAPRGSLATIPSSDSLSSSKSRRLQCKTSAPSYSSGKSCLFPPMPLCTQRASFSS